MSTPPQILVLFLPLVVTVISGWLSHARLPGWINATIALMVLLGASVLWALVSQSLVGDLVADVALIASYCAALMAGPLSPLHQWLTANLPSPFAIFDKKPPAIMPVTLRASLGQGTPSTAQVATGLAQAFTALAQGTPTAAAPAIPMPQPSEATAPTPPPGQPGGDGASSAP